MEYLNKKEILKLAMYEIKTNTSNPFMAVMLALELWLKKNNLQIIPTLPKGNDAGEPEDRGGTTSDS